MLLSGRVAWLTELANSREEALDAAGRCLFAGDAKDRDARDSNAQVGPLPAADILDLVFN